MFYILLYTAVNYFGRIPIIRNNSIIQEIYILRDFDFAKNSATAGNKIACILCCACSRDDALT